MSAIEGKRLLAYMHKHAPRSAGGLDGLAERNNLRRQTPYEWAAGTSRPNLNTLRSWATALGVTRAEMVAAMDGLLGAETEKIAAPSMTKRLLAGVMALEKDRGLSAEALDGAMIEAETFERLAQEADARLAERLGRSRRKSDGQAKGRADGQSDVSPGNRRRTR